MDLAAELARHRDFLIGVAYRLLGSMHAAEDVVQDAYLRAERAGTDEVREPRAWMTRIVTRLALDELRSARGRREAYVGPWLPEPLVASVDEGADPADRVTLDDQVSLALLTVLQTLSPPERAVYVLHEAFGVPLHEVARIVGRTPDACRQLASRARRHVQERAPRFDADPDERARVVEAFKVAAEQGDFDTLAGLLDEAVVVRADGGGVVTAARKPITGRERALRTFAAGRRGVQDFSVRTILVNGDPGLLLRADGQLAVLAFVVADGRITHIDIVANPDKLGDAGQL